MTYYSEALDRTLEAFTDPQPGDRFHEMYSFWMYVVWREDDLVAILTASAPCTFPRDAELWIGTIEDYQARFSYRHKSCWVLLADRGNDISGWLESKL